MRIRNQTNSLFTVKNSGNIGIGTANPVAALHLVQNSNKGLYIDGKQDAITINRSGWIGSATIGISGYYGDSRGLRFLMASNETEPYNDALYLETTGNVAMGISKANGSSLRLYRAETPTFKIENEINSLRIGIAHTAGDLCSTSQPGDAVLSIFNNRAIHIDGTMVFDGFIMNDIENNAWLTAYSDKTLTVKGDLSTNTLSLIDNSELTWLQAADNELKIDGRITATEIVVKTDVWADFVFDSDYKLMPLEDLNEYIKENHHLPNIPKEDEVIKNGVNLVVLNRLYLQQLEETTLYLIELNEQNKKLTERINSLERQLKK